MNTEPCWIWNELSKQVKEAIINEIISKNGKYDLFQTFKILLLCIKDLEKRIDVLETQIKESQ